VLNLFFYAQTHSSTWLLLDAVFAGTLAYRGYVAFGVDHKDEARIQQQMARMRQAAPVQAWPQAQSPVAAAHQPPIPPPPPAASPPPASPSDVAHWNT
jgi:type IV secretory pathway VirB10-like protein